MTNLIALAGGTVLVGEYRIERVLGAGGFGITYLAEEMALARLVTIKEYFPADFAARSDANEAAPRSKDCSGDYRWGLDRFIEEAQILARFDHPHIVRVFRYFRANNTGYMVLQFEEGQSLKGWLKGLGRAPRQNELDRIVAPLLDALEVVHKSDYLHRDIAPDNIIIRKDGSPVLIDFGSARGEIAAHSKTVSALVKPGYSPYEQYAETSRQQGPWTDIYALGATLYHAITGKRPPDGPSRMVKDELVPAREAALSSYRPGFLAAIDKALALNVDARPRSIAAWRGDLLAPEPAKPGWLTRALDKKRSADEDHAVRAARPTGPVPPPPDAPGPQGGLLDFVDGLKGRPRDAAAAPQPTAPVAPSTKGSAGKPPITPPPPSADPPPVAPGRAQTVAVQRRPARPRAVQPRPRIAMRSALARMLAGGAIAAGLIVVYRELPRIESRATSVPTSQIATGSIAGTATELEGHDAPLTAVAFSGDGRYVLSTARDDTLKVWRADGGSLVRTIRLEDAATSLSLAGTRALTAHADGHVALWDIDRSERLSSFRRNEADVWSVAFAGRPDRFVASSHDWKVALWDTAIEDHPLHVFEGHDNAAQAVATAPGGKLVASGGADKTVRLWSIDTLGLVRTYRGHRDFVTEIAFSPDGQLLASASLDGNVRIWSTRSARLYRSIGAHKGKVGGLAFSPDGRMLVSGGADGTVRLWDVKRSRTLRAFAGHTGGVEAVAFAPDGRSIASAGTDGTVRLWAITSSRVSSR
ncbi:MAG: serine/threonine-protein kinase [Pseudomonadota bacterium]